MSGSNDSSGLSLEIWAGRALADRLRGCPPAHRELHRWVLRSFVAGRTPGAEHLRRKADALDVELDAALADLEQRDAVWMDPEAHAVRVAYPFSGVPTSHEVALRDSGATAFAMCAVDALGVSFMVHQTTIVRSRDPVSGETIEARIDPAGIHSWEPESTVVVAAVSGGRPSATCCCPHVNFAASRGQAGALLDGSVAPPGAILEMPEAIELGRRIFGSLLEDH